MVENIESGSIILDVIKDNSYYVLSFVYSHCSCTHYETGDAALSWQYVVSRRCNKFVIILDAQCHACMFVVFSSSDESGTDLIHMIRLAFSVLNRLLLLRPDDAPPSPVEHCLSAQPANR